MCTDDTRSFVLRPLLTSEVANLNQMQQGDPAAGKQRSVRAVYRRRFEMSGDSRLLNRPRERGLFVTRTPSGDMIWAWNNPRQPTSNLALRNCEETLS